MNYGDQRSLVTDTVVLPDVLPTAGVTHSSYRKLKEKNTDFSFCIFSVQALVPPLGNNKSSEWL